MVRQRGDERPNGGTYGEDQDAIRSPAIMKAGTLAGVRTPYSTTCRFPAGKVNKRAHRIVGGCGRLRQAPTERGGACSGGQALVFQTDPPPEQRQPWLGWSSAA